MNVLKKIVYADDDQDDLDLFREVADNLPVVVSFFLSGEEMLHSLKGGRLPDLLFLDVHLPLKDGYEILKELKSSPIFKALPVVMLSADSADWCVEKCFALGANYFIPKPISIQSLEKSIAHTIGIDWKNFQPDMQSFVHIHD